MQTHGDDAAFAKLYNAHYALVVRLVLNKIPSEFAEDAQQHIRLAFWKAVKQFDASRDIKFVTYLHHTLQRQYFTVMRHAQRSLPKDLSLSSTVVRDGGSKTTIEETIEDTAEFDTSGIERADVGALAVEKRLSPFEYVVLAAMVEYGTGSPIVLADAFKALGATVSPKRLRVATVAMRRKFG